MINRIRPRAFALACALTLTALGGAAVGGATATAGVSPGEASFLDEIALNGATLPGRTAGETIAAGYTSCDHLRAGGSVLDEVSAVERTYQFEQGVLFVSAASTNLCPDFAS
ncbi:DUF732 domain-containing protein [Nocardia alba]|uniref:Uncharacterized protein DUF732 n=1 Tax=Nocardia alba TaxID=225051 RepID=A0A4R1FTE5_9NOCA|nr:DUF732 domain-containing protein [Nocardia alba]TCJ97540.1 uncharacterized protein DUF732 [Nocardia alba]